MPPPQDKRKKEQPSSPGTPAGSRSEEFRKGKSSSSVMEATKSRQAELLKTCSFCSINNDQIQHLMDSFADGAKLHIRHFGSCDRANKPKRSEWD